MKLLFDQNLSHRLVDITRDLFPNSSHVKFHGLSEENDLVMYNFAKEQGFTIVTQDSDLYDIALVKGVPPRIVWIRSGNSSTLHIADLLKNNAVTIRHFITDTSKICLELF